MATIFHDFLQFFGVTATAPNTLGELIPWLLSICFAIAFVLFFIRLVERNVRAFGKGARF